MAEESGPTHFSLSWVCSVCLYQIKEPTEVSWSWIGIRCLGKRQLLVYKSMNQGGGCIMVTSDGWPLGTDWKTPHLNSRQLEPCPMPRVQYQHRWSRQLEDTVPALVILPTDSTVQCQRWWWRWKRRMHSFEYSPRAGARQPSRQLVCRERIGDGD